MHTTFLVNKINFQETKITESQIPTPENLRAGQVLAKVHSFALTANNITYAVVGEQVGYWNFYPFDENLGIIPAWGFAEIVASNNENINISTRIYGFLPMSSYVILEAGNIQKNGFYDIANHRQKLAPVYNFYVNIENDKSFQVGSEAIQMIFRPLFTTSFLLDYFLQENNFFNSKNIILTSASSKTAFSLAFMLQETRKVQNLDFKIIGLTSEKNQEFVKNLGFYEEVLTYENFDKTPQEASTIIDFSGNQKLLIDLQKYLKDKHQNTTMVGLSHWQETQGERAKGKFFFAPDWIKRADMSAMGKVWVAFITQIETQLNFLKIKDFSTLEEIYLKILGGNFASQNAYIVHL